MKNFIPEIPWKLSKLFAFSSLLRKRPAHKIHLHQQVLPSAQLQPGSHLNQETAPVCIYTSSQGRIVFRVMHFACGQWHEIIFTHQWSAANYCRCTNTFFFSRVRNYLSEKNKALGSRFSFRRSGAFFLWSTMSWPKENLLLFILFLQGGIF